MASTGKLIRRSIIEIYDEPETPFESVVDDDLMEAVAGEIEEDDATENEANLLRLVKRQKAAKTPSRRR
jgi:hypothetical protein